MYSTYTMINFQIRINRVSEEGKPVHAYGLRLGYWPCKKAPFAQLGLGKRTYEVWVNKEGE